MQVDGLTATVAQLEGDKASVTKQMEKHKVGHSAGL
jgi:hypothetical protein